MIKIRAASVSFAAVLALVTTSHAVVTIDGALDGDYGAPITVQDNETGYGDSNLGTVGFANGSELDVGHGIVQGGTLFLFLGGNLESNFNKLDIFIDSIAGGQNRLLAGSTSGGLNRMGDDGSGNGLTFDAAFAADYLIILNGGGGTPDLFADMVDIPTVAGGTGSFLGQTTYGSGGTLSGGANPFGILLTINNANTAGVVGGSGVGNGAGVVTGAELAIPLAAIGNPVGPIRVSAFINNGNQDGLANQVLGGLGGSGNLGEPRVVNFENIARDQYFTVVPEPSTLAFLGLGVIGVGLRALRRKIA